MIDSSYEIKRQKKKKNLCPHSSVVRRHVARSIEPKASVRRVGGAFAGQARGKYGLIAWIWITELCTRRPSPLSRAQGTDTRGELPQRGRQKKGALKYLSKFHPCTFCAEAATAIEKRERERETKHVAQLWKCVWRWSQLFVSLFIRLLSLPDT